MVYYSLFQKKIFCVIVPPKSNLVCILTSPMPILKALIPESVLSSLATFCFPAPVPPPLQFSHFTCLLAFPSSSASVTRPSRSACHVTFLCFFVRPRFTEKTQPMPSRRSSKNGLGMKPRIRNKVIVSKKRLTFFRKMKVRQVLHPYLLYPGWSVLPFGDKRPARPMIALAIPPYPLHHLPLPTIGPQAVWDGGQLNRFQYYSLHGGYTWTV